MRHFAIAVAVLAVFTLVFGAPASADLIAYEGFDYTAETSVGGKAGGLGWTGSWSAPTGGAAIMVKPDSLSFLNLVTEGNKVYAVPNGGAVAGTQRALASSRGAATETVYASFLVDYVEGNRYLGLSLYDNSTQKVFIGKNTGESNWRVSSGPFPTLDSGVAITTDSTLLVLRMDFNYSGNNERLSLFVNPAPGLPEPLPDDSKITTQSFTFNGIGIGSGYTSGSNPTTLGYFDEIRIGTTWKSVTTPEPSAGLLLALGVLGVALMRRRKQSGAGCSN